LNPKKKNSKKRSIARVEHDLRRPAGRRNEGGSRVLHTRKAPLKDCQGNVTHVVSITRHATESKRMEQKLRESEARYRGLFENCKDAITINTSDGKFLDFNQAHLDLLGYSRDEMLELNASDVYANPTDRDRFRQEIERNGFVESYEVELRRKDGTVRNCLLTSTAWRNGEGHILSYQGIVRDITERKRMEEALKSSEQRLRILFEYAPDAYYLNDLKGTLIDGNKAAEKTTGFKKEELIGKSFLSLKLLPPEQIPKAAALLLKNALGQPTGPDEFTLNRKDGNLITVEIRTYPVKIRDKSLVLGIARDITERKRLEKELRRHSENLEKLVEERTRDVRESEEKFRRIYNASLDAIYTTSLGGEIVDMNPAGVSMLGFDSLDELKKVNIESRYVNLEDRKRLIELASKGPVRDFEVQFRRKDGERIDAIINCNPLKDEQDRITALQGAIIDITELKQFQKKLLDSEERFRGIAERSFDMIVTLDLEGRVTYASPAVTWITGYTPEEMVGQHFQNYLPKDAIPKEIQAFVEIAKGGVSRAVQLRIVRKDGSLAQAEVNASPIMSDGKIAGVQAIIRDVTERLAIERMRDRFISAVTHELRTPLVSIKGYVDLVLDGSQSIPEEVESRLQVAKRNTDRLLSLVNDLLDVQRMQAERLELEIQPTDFNKVVDSCMTEIQPLLEERKLSLRLEVPEGELRIEGDQTRLCQALMNLLSNAAKFSPEGSEVTLHVEEGNESIKVQVSDRGIGIRKEDLKRVFEPFAAIEKPDYVKGTGLGLSITKGLVEAHGGKIWAESPGEGKGATFTFTLPRRKEND